MLVAAGKTRSAKIVAPARKANPGRRSPTTQHAGVRNAVRLALFGRARPTHHIWNRIRAVNRVDDVVGCADAGDAMIRFITGAVAIAATLVAVGQAAASPGPQQVDLREGNSPLKGYVYVPDGQGPFPVVVAMHGCEGLRNPSGVIASRYRDWAERLGKAGFAVVYPDSYGSRDLGPQCRNRAALRRTNRERVADATTALAWLQRQAFAKPDRVSLLGWSSGAISVLWTVRPQAAVHDERPDFRSALALYPGCNRLETSAWSTRI